MTNEPKEVNIIPPKDNNHYTEKEILQAWNEVGREHNGLTFAWILEKLRANKNGLKK
jgi:hypothetical protein